MSTSWKWPGSRWWRVDFHAHTPRSYDHNRDSPQAHPDWAGWITAARDAGLQAIAITDHNTADAVEHLQQAAAGIEGAPILFSGVELTANGGWHLLVLLDPARRRSHVEDLLSRVKIPADQRGKKTCVSPLSVEMILNELGDSEALIIGAHVNGPKGILKLTGETLQAVLRHPRLAGVEVNPCLEVETGWLDGSVPEIGRSIPQVWSSDAHSLNDLGKRFTWVKMTEPNLEGLRLALLDGASSVKPVAREEAGDPNAYPDLALESITVEAAKYMGQPEPMTVRFGPWLNAIIGGRGTGKSTLVDFTRTTLRRESELDGSEGGEEGPLREYFDRRMSVPPTRADEGLLTPETRIEVIYRKDGERYMLSWNQKGDLHPIVHLIGTKRTPQEGRISERFPVRIYSQKQLFALARDPNALRVVIDDSRTVRRNELNRVLEDQRNRYLSLCAEAREARNRAGGLPGRRAELHDVVNKLEILQKGGHSQAFEEHRIRRQQNDTWEAVLQGASQAVEEVKRSAGYLFVSDLNLANAVEDSPSMMSLRRGHESLRLAIETLRRQVRAAVAQAQREIREISSGPDILSWREAMEDIQTAFEAAVAELAEQGISGPGQYSNLLERAAELRREIENLEEEKRRAEQLESRATGVLAEYRKQRQELSDRRRAFSEETSSDTISVAVSPYSSTEDLLGELARILGTERYRDDRQAIAQGIRGAQDETWGWEGLDTIVAEMRRLLSGDLEYWAAKDGRFDSFLRRAAPERIDRLALYLPEDTITVRFREDVRGKWRVLSQGSPGQQTAALLSFVLGYGEEPILLDQPEDDLDNTLIYELLVRRIRETKLKRQVIVVTHNPNIVVHGDAEMVLSLEVASGQSRIAYQGGLQERAVRDEICRVMEGGREAFESRYQRIMPPVSHGP